jgi:hypothetical protein
VTDEPAVGASVPPRTPLEGQLAELWARLLDVASVGVHDDFFAAGGDSLLATQLLARIYDRLRVELPFSAFFDAPTVAAMAERIEALIAAGGAAPPPAVAPPPREHAVPASVAQERLWELAEALPGLPFFSILYAMRVRGPLEPALLRASLDEIVRRHEILRTSFAVRDGRAVQVVAPALPVPLAVDDLRGMPEAEQDAHGQERLSEEALRPFDLRRGPLLRARLLRWDDAEATLVLGLHQAIADGWSLGVLAEELAVLYDALVAGSPSPLAPPSLQFGDFAAWQRDWPAREATRAQLAYWRAQLRGPLPALELVPDRPGRGGPGLRTARRPVALPRELAEGVARLGRSEGVTVFMVLLAALAILLRRELGESDVRVATLVANRNRPGSDELIGPLVNTVVLRLPVDDGLAARELLQRIRATTLAAHANADVPFEDLAPLLAREHGVTPRFLAPVMLVLQNATLRARARTVGTLEIEEANPSMPMPLVGATTFDVVLNLHESDRALAGACVYNAERYDAATIDRLLDRFHRVLRCVVEAPGQRVASFDT